MHLCYLLFDYERGRSRQGTGGDPPRLCRVCVGHPLSDRNVRALVVPAKCLEFAVRVSIPVQLAPNVFPFIKACRAVLPPHVQWPTIIFSRSGRCVVGSLRCHADHCQNDLGRVVAEGRVTVWCPLSRGVGISGVLPALRPLALSTTPVRMASWRLPHGYGPAYSRVGRDRLINGRPRGSLCSPGERATANPIAVTPYTRMSRFSGWWCFSP